MNPLHNRLVHDAVMTYDRATSDGTFRRGVMSCFLPEMPSSPEAIEAFMTDIFDLMLREIDRFHSSWRIDMSGDEVETAIHDGLQFTARVDRFRRSVLIRLYKNRPDSPERPTTRWPAGLMTEGSPRTEFENLVFKLH
jgi:hypothetical protein